MCMARANRNQSMRNCSISSTVGVADGAYKTSCQQINGIPDAVIGDDAVDDGEDSHGDAARQSALDAGRYGINP